MIRSAKPGLAQYIVHNAEFPVICYTTNTLDKDQAYPRETKPILSSDRMLRKGYERKGSATKKNGREPQGPWRHDELFGSKQPVAK
jgi:hypothetical protein